MNDVTMPSRLSPFSHGIWDMKYRLKDGGRIVDTTIESTWRRISKALAAPETVDADLWAGRFFTALEDFKFLPAGRIIAGAGTQRDVTLFNCFVMGTIPDDMSGIFHALREAALTMQQGGGIGYDFSTLRPKGALVKGVDADASGPLPFMDTWDAMCRTIMSAGYRRGAMMATLRCDHPDIEAFVEAKREPGRLRMFNLSVLITDAFMDAMRGDRPWPLVFGGKVYRTVSARDLWNKIMRSTYGFAEPGVIFIDRINKRNNLAYCETISATNPCGEQPLPPYGACLLGSINLAALVVDPFTDKARLDLDELDRIVPLAVRAMDNVVEASRFPLPEQQKEAVAKRRIGLGITGLADALIMCRLRYGSSAAVRITERWMKRLQRQAYLASVNLAKEKGAFPLFDAEKFTDSETVLDLDEDVFAAIRQHGIRNALLTSIAPTGTISALAENVSSGLEPVFAFEYERKVLQPDGTKKTSTVEDFAYRLFRQKFGPEVPLPDYFVSTAGLTPAEHVEMQAACQKYVDASISKTINVPEDIDFESFKDVYIQAYETGCKGCTTYRPNDVTGSVLSVKGSAQPAAVIEELPTEQRPSSLEAKVIKLEWPPLNASLYLTVAHVRLPVSGRFVVYEVFLSTPAGVIVDWSNSTARGISYIARYKPSKLRDYLEKLAQQQSPASAWVKIADTDEKPVLVPSVVALVAKAILRRIDELDAMTATAPAAPTLTDEVNDEHQSGDERSAREDAGRAAGNGRELSLGSVGGDAERAQRSSGKAARPAPSRSGGELAPAAAPGGPSDGYRRPDGKGASAPAGEPRGAAGVAKPHLTNCPKCNVAAVVHGEGCDSCTNCDYSKCG